LVSRVWQDFDSATVHATDGLDSARASLGDLLPYFEPWGNSLALTGKVRCGGAVLPVVVLFHLRSGRKLAPFRLRCF